MRTRTAVLALTLTSAVGCADFGGTPSAPAPPLQSTETESPAEALVEVTAAAEAELVRVVRQDRITGRWMLRLTVRPGGCTGMTDHLGLDTGPVPTTDATTRAGAVTVVYARDQYAVIQGARIDFGEKDGRRGFLVTYPNKTAENRARTADWIKAAFPNSGLVLDPVPDADRPAEQP